MSHPSADPVFLSRRRRMPVAILTPLLVASTAWAEDLAPPSASAADCPPALVRCEAGLTGLRADLQAAADAAAAAARQRDEIESRRAATERAAVQLQMEKSSLEARVQTLDGETERLKAELAQVRETVAAREQDAESLRADNTRLADAGRSLQGKLETAEADARDLHARIAALEADRARQKVQIADLETARAGLDARLTQQTEEHRALGQRLGEAASRSEGLAAQLDGLRQKNAALELDRSRGGERIAALEAQLGALRSEIPVSDGGTITADALRGAAGEAAARLARAHQAQIRNPRDPALRADLEAAVSALADSQARVARATGARGMHRVRPGDTLARVARQSYGDGGQWQTVFEANRHVLADPDRLIPSMTLVVP